MFSLNFRQIKHVGCKASFHVIKRETNLDLKYTWRTGLIILLSSRWINNDSGNTDD